MVAELNFLLWNKIAALLFLFIVATKVPQPFIAKAACFGQAAL